MVTRLRIWGQEFESLRARQSDQALTDGHRIEIGVSAPVVCMDFFDPPSAMTAAVKVFGSSACRERRLLTGPKR